MANVCTVTGILRWSSGALAKSVAVHVVQPGIRRTWDGAALPIVATATSDAVTGVVTFDLIPGFYQLVWQDDLGAVQVGMRVPDAATAWLNDITQSPPTAALRNLLQSADDLTAPVWRKNGVSVLPGNVVDYPGGGAKNDGVEQWLGCAQGGKTFTVSAVISGSGQVRIKNTHRGVVDNYSPDITLTPTPNEHHFTVTNGLSSGTAQAGGIVRSTGNGPFTCTVHHIRLFDDPPPAPPAYDNDTCRIVGTIRKTSGAPAANETVHIVQDNIRRAWDGAALPVVQTVVSDGNGVVDFPLIPGHYRLVWQDATAQAQHRLYVPDAPFVWLADAAAGRESEWSPHFLFAQRQDGHWSDTQEAL